MFLLKGSNIGHKYCLWEDRFMNYLKKLILFISRINKNIGKIFSLLLIPTILILIYEVVSRYLFNRPTIWANELSAFLFSIMFLTAGSFTLSWNEHVRVDVFYAKFSRKTQCIVDLFTWIMFYLFVGVIFFDGYKYAYHSVKIMEVSNTPWAPYVWPVKLFIPMAGFLMLLQGLTKTIGDIYFVFTNKELIEKGGMTK